jgi:hypothetical protein
VLATLVVVLLPTAASAAPIAAVVGPEGDADVRTSILVGPSGQVYAGDGAGTWTRSLAGGVAADVSGATRLGKDLIVTGVSTPLYRFDGTGWTALRLGQNGKTVMGRGPAPAVAVGKHVFVHDKGKWVRVAQAPGTVTALWASSAKKVFVVTAAGIHALRASELVRTRAAVGAIVGASPWGVGDTGVIDASSGKAVLDAAGAVAATGGAGTPWIVTSDGTSPLKLVGKIGGKATTIDTPIPAGTALAGLAADKAGRVVIVTAAGEAHLWADAAWSTGALVDKLPEPRTGAGPAKTR